MILVSDIQARVAHEYGVPSEIMREPDNSRGSRLRDNARARQVAMLLSYRLTGHSYAKIGRLFGKRDHSTVHYSCQKVRQRSCSDPALRQALRRITFELVAG